jgi:hypothetical protein
VPSYKDITWSAATVISIVSGLTTPVKIPTNFFTVTETPLNMVALKVRLEGRLYDIVETGPSLLDPNKNRIVLYQPDKASLLFYIPVFTGQKVYLLAKFL